LNTLRSDPLSAGVKIVALAGRISPRQRQVLLRKGFDAVLTEPYNPEDILSLFDEIARVWQ